MSGADLAEPAAWPAATRSGAPRRDTANVLAFSSLYPNAAMPRHGIFLQHRLAHLAAEPGMALRVVAPVPWFPRSLRAIGSYAHFAEAPLRSDARGIRAVHPRYPLIPKVGTSIAAVLMAAAMVQPLRRIRAEGFAFDVIDAYYLYPDGVAAAMLGALFNRPVVLTAFGSDVSLLPSIAAARAQILWALRRAAGGTAVCRALRDRLEQLGAEGRKIEIILHGVDLELFRPPADREALRRRLGFAGPTLLSAGHLIPRKGNSFAIGALAQVPGVTLVIAGTGPEDQALRDQAVRLGVQDRVRFLGHVDQAALPDLMGAADGLVLCSDREGIANVLMEAMACGTPVAATAIWGTPEVVCVPEAGVLIAERTEDAVVEGMRALLAAPPDRAMTRRWAEHFTWTDTARRHAAVIRSACLAVRRSAA
jgi:glycosyltransferase involved in cell wall biosynthesis